MSDSLTSDLTADGTEQSAEIMALLTVDPSDLVIPAKHRKVQDIIKFFKDKSNIRGQILKVLNRDNREDKVDAVWVWIELQKQRAEKIGALNPEDFVQDVHEQIKSGILTKDNMDKVRRQIKARKEEIAKENRGLDIERRDQYEQAQEKSRQASSKASQIAEKEAEATRLEEMEQSFDEIEGLTDRINSY